EYLLPRADAAAAVEALQGLAERFSSLLFVGELRTVAEDALWLSPAYGTPTVGVHFTWRAVPDAVRTLLPTIEAALPETARPHWAKVATMAPDAIRARYERWDDFAALRTRFDPERRFVNPHLARFGL
ncbi:MAG: sorbitol oxidase, partial [Propionibacteriaceae bacterium]|nr:sorbitol oxidase [Propionibacteriaceae bacterium]